MLKLLRLPQPLRQAAGGIVLAAVSLHAQGANLLEVYRQALSNDPTFDVARHGLEVAQEKVPQALAGLLPTVSMTGSENYTGANASFNESPSQGLGYGTWAWTLQLTQPLFRLQNNYAYRESQAQVESAEADFAQAEQDLILRVAQAYFDALVAQEDIASAKAQLDAMEEQSAEAKRGFELGTMSITDSYEARSKAEQARAQLISAQNALEVKQAELEKLTNVPPTILAGLKPAVVMPLPQPSDPKVWIDQAKDDNPTVRSQISALKAAGFSVYKAESENIWTLDFVASYGQNYSGGNVLVPSGYESRVKTNVVGVQFSVPIFAGGLNSSDIRVATANRDKLAAQLEETRRKAGTDARQAYSGIVSDQAQIEALRAAVESGENSVKGNQAGYRLGIRINSDVLDAQQQLYGSKRDLIKARYDTLMQGLKLKAAAGVLTGADVEVINGMLVYGVL